MPCWYARRLRGTTLYDCGPCREYDAAAAALDRQPLSVLTHSRTQNRYALLLETLYRFRLPRMPRTMARPSWVATVRVTLFIAASITVSR